MRRIRVIPILLIDSNMGLVKTVKFGRRTYIGDPINAVKIFNDKGVDELILLDIDATRERREPNFAIVEEIASEAFMPIGYGGGITTLTQMTSLLRAGVEKIVLNSSLISVPELVTEAATTFGSQSVVVSIDVRSTLFRGEQCFSHNGSKRIGDPVMWAKKCEELGAGEIVLTSIDRDGTYAGYNVNLLRQVAEAVKIPVVANGGARSVSDFAIAAIDGGCSAVAAASMFVYAAKGEGVLIRFPDERELESAFWSKVQQT